MVEKQEELYTRIAQSLTGIGSTRSSLWSKLMLKDIVAATPLGDYRLELTFEDGVTGIVDINRCVSLTGVFAPLRDPKQFAAVQVNPELGTVCWPCGADLDPDVLYALVTGSPVPNLEPVKESS
jgi:hypothetical protein